MSMVSLRSTGHMFGCFVQALGGGSNVCFIGTAVPSPQGLDLILESGRPAAAAVVAAPMR